MGVVHYRGALTERGCSEVVLQTERVAHFVRGELAGARENHRFHIFGDRLAFDVRDEKRLGDQVVLLRAQAAQRHLALDDLAGAGIGDGFAIAPAAGGAVNPLDHVVADVHGVGAFGQDFDAKGVPETGSLKCLRPPVGAFDQRGANGLGRAAIDVVDDGLDRLADGGLGVALLQPVARNEPLIETLAERHGVVAVIHSEES